WKEWRNISADNSFAGAAAGCQNFFKTSAIGFEVESAGCPGSKSALADRASKAKAGAERTFYTLFSGARKIGADACATFWRRGRRTRRSTSIARHPPTRSIGDVTLYSIARMGC